LAENDVISPRFGFLAGELSLFRNVERVNSIYRESRDYEKVFTSDRCWNFCEFGFFRDRTVESMTHVMKRAAADGRVRLFSEDMLRTDRKLRGRPFRYYWQQGKLADLDSGENLLLYHFLDRKKSEAFDVPPMPESLPHGFVVTELGVEFMQQPLPVPRRRLGHWLGRLGKSARRWKRRLSVGRGG
jgi:hypothetical protein